MRIEQTLRTRISEDLCIDFALLKMVSKKLQVTNTFDKLEIDSYNCNESESSTKNSTSQKKMSKCAKYLRV
ncbi:hypothetical protein HZH68_015464 [Vespula germanica]|uniref:Uncharacterized protein n=1 Tax=Vespula germanica TaxID=30212 RepID=A0A834MRK6_VESGE|nr:hypothetical protein HZH68_015464 [Vespula germanica]